MVPGALASLVIAPWWLLSPPLAAAWRQESKCLNDPLVHAVQKRVSDVTRTPVANGEFAQLAPSTLDSL